MPSPESVSLPFGQTLPLGSDHLCFTEKGAVYGRPVGACFDASAHGHVRTPHRTGRNGPRVTQPQALH